MMGAAIAVFTVLACLGVMAERDPSPIGLDDLERLNAPLMSCDHASDPGGALLWCADPNSPQCIPALPVPPRPELGDRPDLDVFGMAQVAHATFVVLPWPRPELSTLRGRRVRQRIERPPRA